MKPLILIGMGGHSKVVHDIANKSKEFKVVGFLDNNIKQYHQNNDLFFDNLDNINKYKSDFYFIIAIGDNETRKRIFNSIGIPLNKYPVLIHETATIGKDTYINNGTVVMAHAVVNPSTKIGSHTIINTGVIVEHDNYIKDYVHISPGAVVTGGVKIGERTQIGANASVIPNLSIGQNVIVGAGSTVINDIEDNIVVVGSPARKLRSMVNEQ